MKENFEFIQQLEALCEQYPNISPEFFIRYKGNSPKGVPVSGMPNLLTVDTKNYELADFVLQCGRIVFPKDTDLYCSLGTKIGGKVTYRGKITEGNLTDFHFVTISGEILHIPKYALDKHITSVVPGKTVRVCGQILNNVLLTPQGLRFIDGESRSTLYSCLEQVLNDIMAAALEGKNVNLSISRPKEKAKFKKIIEFI